MLETRTGEEVVEADRLRSFTSAVFEGLGMNRADSSQLADVLVWADLRGSASLGVAKIPQYVSRLRAGGTNATGQPTTVRERGVFAIVDGDDAWGHVAGSHAMRMAVDKARSAGVGLVVVRNTTSAGALSYYAMMAAREQMIGFAINNSPPLQPAWGGTGKSVGNQAFAIAAPAHRHDPLLLDMATSAITLAKIHEYQSAGAPLPDGVALNAAGEPTVAPAEALAGILLPMGGHRGYGLALMWEVLTGVLAGGDRFGSNVTMPDEFGKTQGVSMLLLAIDPEVSMPYDTFTSRVDTLIDWVHQSAPAPGVDRVRVPGERSLTAAAERAREGIALPEQLTTKLKAIGTELGVVW